MDQEANDGSRLNSARVPEIAPEKPSRFTSAAAIILYIAAAKLLLHLLTAGQYGFFAMSFTTSIAPITSIGDMSISLL